MEGIYILAFRFIDTPYYKMHFLEVVSKIAIFITFIDGSHGLILKIYISNRNN